MSSSKNQASTPPNQGRRPPPLVIVSELGGRSEESRRIVRAQAARASAAQSRVTRARNREEREGAIRENVQSPPPSESTVPSATSSGLSSIDLTSLVEQKPLARWLTSMIGVAASDLVEQALNAGSTLPSSVSNTATLATSLGSWDLRANFPAPGMLSPNSPGKFQLPLALPRGFATLQQRLPLSDTMTKLLSQTACIDFASPGVDQRLHQLLFDLIINAATLGIFPQSGHPIQGHLRIACTCLTIFQGQRANGAVFANDQKYNVGLEAAWSEATTLDQAPLQEPKAAEASLWAVFIISVTTGASVEFFDQRLHALLRDLQLEYWEQVRKVLLDFTYPVSFLDEPCKAFYNHLNRIQSAVS